MDQIDQSKRARHCEAAKRWREKNKSAKNAYDVKWREEHKEEKAEYERKWREANPERVRALERRYQQRKVQNGGEHTKEEFAALCDLYGNKCLCCAATTILVEDHVIPVSKGGSNNINNIQPLCVSCNSRKRDKTIDYRPDWR